MLLDDSRATLYVDLVFLHLSEAARVALEEEMKLEARGFHVGADLRAQINTCDLDALDELLRRATSIETLDDLFR